MNLLKRGNTYHFRIRIPSDLTPEFSRKEIQQSLKTDDKRTARSRALRLSRLLNDGFDQVRQAISLKRSQYDVDELITNLLTSIGGTRRRTLSEESEETIIDMSNLIAAYLKEKKPSVEQRTFETMEYSFQLVIHFIGNINLNRLNRSVCRDYRDKLSGSPKYLLRDANASITQSPISTKSVNKHMQFFSSMLRWAAREEFILGNPADGLTIKRKTAPWEERLAFSKEDLNIIFDNLWNEEHLISRRWVPIISLFSGMRLEEICQLRHCDLIEQDGIYCFSISPEAGAIKTAAAERLVPVHSKLIDMGLLELASPDPNQGPDRLWNDLSPNKYGRYSNSVGKWFGRYKRRKGFNDNRHCFHSLRHTFINELKQIDAPEPVIRQMVGHADNSITMGRYGKRYDVKKMKQWIEKVGYPYLFGLHQECP
jgi:integrase